MNGANIGTFDSNSPADTESAGLGDDRIRSTKTTLQQAMDDEHHFPAAGGSVVGYHRLGSARPYVGTQSRVSSSGTDGRLMVTSDTSRLFGVGSGGTMFLGGSQVVSVGTNADTAGGRHHWVEEVGHSRTGSNGSVTITVPNSGFSGEPYVWCQQRAVNVSDAEVDFIVVTVSASQFIVQSMGSIDGGGTYLHAVARSNVSFYWRSLGTRAL